MAEPQMQVYESTTLGTPPLRMVLVHAHNEAQNAAVRVPPPAPADVKAPLDKEQVVRRIIEHLETLE